MDYSLPGSSVHGIFQARVLEWVAISFSRGSSRPGIEPESPALQADAFKGFPGGSDGRESACMQEIQVLSLGWEDPLEKGMAALLSILAWRIPWTEQPGRPQFMES